MTSPSVTSYTALKFRLLPAKERFILRTDKSPGHGPNGDCWLWMGKLKKSKYGRIKRDGETVSVHRFAYELAHGPIPDGLSVLHHCDNTHCVREDHLFLGNQDRNMKDMAAKGRSPRGAAHWTKRMPEKILRGEQRPQATMTESIVRTIRSMSVEGIARREISATLGISIRNVGKIVTGAGWAHVTAAPPSAGESQAKPGRLESPTAGSTEQHESPASVRRVLPPDTTEESRRPSLPLA